MLKQSFNRGDEVGFNATIKSLGDESHTKHFHLRNIWRESGHIELPPHTHEEGRYSD